MTQLPESNKPVAQSQHKIFISYHQADQSEAEIFIRDFGNDSHKFIRRAEGATLPDLLDPSEGVDIVRRIRQDSLKDSTVTIVLIGNDAWAEHLVDWEIEASLHTIVMHTDLTQTDTTQTNATEGPNGLLGIKLHSYDDGEYPTGLNQNLNQRSQLNCYARVISYPIHRDILTAWIEDADRARSTRKDLIVSRLR